MNRANRINFKKERVVKIQIKKIRDAISESSIFSCTDIYGTITYVNDNFCRISGYSREELVGAKHSIVNSGYHDKSFWRDAWTAVSSGKAWRAEVCNRTKDGRFYWVDTFIYPLLRMDGKPEGYFSIRNDITQRKEQEFAIEYKNALLEKIAWIQSHEMRRPVSTILGLIQLLNANDPENGEIIRMLHESSQELDQKIKMIVRLTESIETERSRDVNDDNMAIAS